MRSITNPGICTAREGNPMDDRDARIAELAEALQDASSTLDDVIESLVGNIGGPVEDEIIEKLSNLDDRLQAAARAGQERKGAGDA